MYQHYAIIISDVPTLCYSDIDTVLDLGYRPVFYSLNYVRILFSLAVNLNLQLHQMLKSFLTGNLSKDVYIEQPPYSIAQGELVHKLHKMIYGSNKAKALGYINSLV